MIQLEGRRASHRACKGTNRGELWLIDESMKDANEIELVPQVELAPGLKLVRMRGESYDFGKMLWKRADGDICEEEPGHIYIVAEQVPILPPMPVTPP